MTYRYKVRYFKPEEFKCPCCGKGRAALLLVLALDLFRAAWGAPVHVNSGFRCEKHNAEVKGSPMSRHMLGCAADIAPVTLRDDTRADILDRFKSLVRQMFAIPDWEVKVYPWGVHVAVPRQEGSRLWDGDVITL